MSTVSETSKAMRGTKRVCHACAVRFYDLARSPIVCPSCGEQHTPEARQIFDPGARVAPFSAKTGWRSKSFKRAGPTLPEAEPQIAAAPDAVAAEDAVEEAADAGPEDDIVLEQEPDDGDVAGLIDVDVEEPKER